MGFLNEKGFNMELFLLFLGKRVLTLGKGVLLGKWGGGGMDFMKGILALDFHKPLSWRFGPTESERNALSLFHLKDLKC